MSDLFGRRDQVLMGGLSSDSMFMSWPNLTAFGLGLLIQQVGMNYRQPIRRIFELGPGVVPVVGDEFVDAAFCDDPTTATSICDERTQATYYIIGRPEGRLQLDRFVGPQALTCDFYRKYGSACAPNVVTISGKAGCSATDSNAKNMHWFLNGVTIDDYAARATGQEMVMNEGIGAMFTSLKLLVDGDTTCG